MLPPKIHNGIKYYGNRRVGDLRHNRKLTTANVIFILFNKGVLTGKHMAEMFGCSDTAIYEVLSGDTWKHIWKNMEFIVSHRNRRYTVKEVLANTSEPHKFQITFVFEGSEHIFFGDVIYCSRQMESYIDSLFDTEK